MSVAANGCVALSRASEHARVVTHCGEATVVVDGEHVAGPAEFLLPVEGPPYLALWSERSFVSTPGTDLTLVGQHDGRKFRLTCPSCHLHKTMTGRDRGWTLVSPRNHPVRISYGEGTAVAGARILLNNFDFGLGDVVKDGSGWTRMGTPFAVELGERPVTFRRRSDYEDVQPLVAAGLLRSASLVEVACEATGTDDDLLAFGLDIAGFSTFARGGAVSVAMVELLSADGGVVRRIVTQPVQSRFSSHIVVPDHELQRLFEGTFDEHVRMRRSNWPWHKLPSYCGSVEDPPYLEQKFVSLMVANEFFMRTSLLEDGLEEDRVDALDLNDLLGEARKRLRWNIPKHYNARNATLAVRNAVAHGSDPPTKDSAELRRLFDKWRLFLMRRILIRLGYKGTVLAPRMGFYESLPVDDFSEEHNSFDTDQQESHPWAKFAKDMREMQRSRSSVGATSEPAADGVEREGRDGSAADGST